MNENKQSEIPRRGVRCGACYWALYDGHLCQNPDCQFYSQDMWETRIYLSNKEAMTLINAKSADTLRFDIAKGDELPDEIQHCNKCGKQKVLSGICEHHWVCEDCDIKPT